MSEQEKLELKKARKEFLLGFAIAALIAISSVNLVILVNREGGGGFGSPPLLEVNIIYQGENITEQVKVLGYNTNEETGLILAGANDYIYVKFYNLNKSENYRLDRAGFFDYQFTNTSEITFLMRVYEDNWCYLSKDLRDLMWVWIGTIGE